MAFSIESRVPFLDYRLVEFAFGVPYDEKISNGITKLILRKSMAGRLPESVRLRKDKMGFPAPLAKWIRKDLKEPIHDALFSPKMYQRGILNHKIIGQRYEDHLTGRSDHTWEIWRWFTLETWFRRFIDETGWKASSV
jgi:asparagine synthase (glutamine-hydrolysing)